MTQKKIIFTVINDLNYDQRMQRICSSLTKAGYEVTLVGRTLSHSKPLSERPYKQVRLNCKRQKGKLFYLEYNIKLYRYLKNHLFDIVCSVDLDTVVPCYKIARKKRIPIVFDAHEYFSEVPEVVTRPKIQKFWEYIQQKYVSKIDYKYTVSASLAKEFQQRFNQTFEVIRNIRPKADHPKTTSNSPYLIYVGAVNMGRGLEMLIDIIPDIPLELHICGDGDILNDLKQLVKKRQLIDKVIFTGFMRPEELQNKADNAFIGTLILENKGKSYYYSLANKFFDYMHAGIPQVTINFPEYQNINTQIEVAKLVEYDKEQIKEAILSLINNPEEYNRLSENCLKAREVFNWQQEEKKLLEFYRKIP